MILFTFLLNLINLNEILLIKIKFQLKLIFCIKNYKDNNNKQIRLILIGK